MAIPTITPLPDPPLRTQDQATFNDKAYPFMSALPAFQAETNNTVVAINSTAATIAAQAAQAAADAITAANAASAAVGGLSTQGTSSTSMSIGTGTKSFTMDTGKTLVPGQPIYVSSRANTLNQMIMRLTSYNSGTGAVVAEVLFPSGSGTFTDWSIGLASVPAQVGRFALFFPAQSLTPRSTAGAAVNLTESATNKVMSRTLAFDPSTIEYAQIAVRLPKAWNKGTVTFVPVWSHAGTTTNFKVSWGLRAFAASNDDAIDNAFGTPQFSNDTGGTTDDVYMGPESSPITVAGAPVDEDLVTFEIYRKADDASNDTLAVDARLIGFTLYIIVNQGTDS